MHDVDASANISGILSSAPFMSTTAAAFMATSAPDPMAIPRSACASAGASLMPSPTMATREPRFSDLPSMWRPSPPFAWKIQSGRLRARRRSLRG